MQLLVQSVKEVGAPRVVALEGQAEALYGALALGVILAKPLCAKLRGHAFYPS